VRPCHGAGELWLQIRISSSWNCGTITGWTPIGRIPGLICDLSVEIFRRNQFRKITTLEFLKNNINSEMRQHEEQEISLRRAKKIGIKKPRS
jgi:hypothetical protein